MVKFRCAPTLAFNYGCMCAWLLLFTNVQMELSRAQCLVMCDLQSIVLCHTAMVLLNADGSLAYPVHVHVHVQRHLISTAKNSFLAWMLLIQLLCIFYVYVALFIL